jgi:hypothetical protein
MILRKELEDRKSLQVLLVGLSGIINPLIWLLKLPNEELAILDLGRFFYFSGGSLAACSRRPSSCSLTQPSQRSGCKPRLASPLPRLASSPIFRPWFGQA